jgi:hypothetical protein
MTYRIEMGFVSKETRDKVFEWLHFFKYFINLSDVDEGETF